MSQKWEIDVELDIGKSRPKDVVEKKGEKLKMKADVVAIHFSSYAISPEPIGPNKNAIPVQGGVFLFLRGKKVRTSHKHPLHPSYSSKNRKFKIFKNLNFLNF